MAQDFGDDMGNALLNFVTRQTENYLRFGRGRNVLSTGGSAL